MISAGFTVGITKQAFLQMGVHMLRAVTSMYVQMWATRMGISPGIPQQLLDGLH